MEIVHSDRWEMMVVSSMENSGRYIDWSNPKKTRSIVLMQAYIYCISFVLYCILVMALWHDG